MRFLDQEILAFREYIEHWGYFWKPACLARTNKLKNITNNKGNVIEIPMQIKVEVEKKELVFFKLLVRKTCSIACILTQTELFLIVGGQYYFCLISFKLAS